MKPYATWKYVLLVLALVFGALYSLPNFYVPERSEPKCGVGGGWIRVECRGVDVFGPI